MKKLKIIILFILNLSIISIYGQEYNSTEDLVIYSNKKEKKDTQIVNVEKLEENDNAQKEFSLLMKDGIQAMNKKNYPKAISQMTKAELIGEQNQWNDKLWDVKCKIGYCYSNLSYYGEAFSYYNEALAIVRNNPSLADKEIEVLNYIALVYSQKDDRNQALKYLKKAYIIAEEKGLERDKKVLSVNMADSYNHLGNYEKAEQQLLKVKSIKASAYAMNLWRVTYAETLFLKGEIDKAYKLSKELYAETNKENTSICNICILELLSEIHAKKGDLDKAILYTKLALKYNRELSPRIDRYKRLANLYKEKKDYIATIKYKDSVLLVKDSLSQKINQQLYETNKIKLNIQEYQNELKLSEKSYKNKIKIFWIIIVAGVLLFFFVYIWQKNRIIKQRQKQVITDNKQKIIALELKQEKNEHIVLEKKMEALKSQSKFKQEKLKNKISGKNRELTANALYNSSRVDLLRKIIQSLEKISDISENEEIRTYLRSLKEHTNTGKQWKEFTTHFEKVNPGFLQKIKINHSALTKKDIRFICYIYMNLNTKEICIILNITPEAFWKRKQRLSEKLNISKEVNLYEYILELEMQ